MPTISVFFGITIRMYFDDHGPPHFHAFYGEHAAKFDIANLEVIAGSFPKRPAALVHEWAQLHRFELTENWRASEQHQPIRRIAPLE